MELLQIFAIVFSLFALSRAILRLRDGKLTIYSFIFWNIVWVGVIIIAFLPNVSSFMANLFGIGRGVDFLIYTSVVILFYLIFRLYIKMEKIDQDITKLVSDLALKNKNDKK